MSSLKYLSCLKFENSSIVNILADCMAGMYWNNVTCEGCALGFYKPLPGNDSCIMCPANQTTMETEQEACGKILQFLFSNFSSGSRISQTGGALTSVSGMKTYYLARFLLKTA